MNMNEIQQEQVLSFCDMCGCDFDIAVDYLRCCDWVVDSAVSLFFDNGGAPLNLPPSENTKVEEKKSEERVAFPILCEHCEGNIHMLNSSTLVYKEECVYCYSSWNDEKGIDICLSCYLGFCSNHTQLHSSKTGHCMYLRIRHKEIIKENDSPSKIVKLGIGIEGGYNEDPKEYETPCSIYCSHCNSEYQAEGVYGELAEKIIIRATGEKEKEIFQWEEENLKPCPHCDTYHLPSPCPSISLDHMKCQDCELTQNLWLCLECGQFHCGRKQFDAGATPGNGHAIQHFKETGHSLVVKVASLQDNHADVHCYQCDENPTYNYGDILFPAIFEILTQFGILKNGKVIGLSADKQEKNLTEANLFLNQEFEFSMNDENGCAYPPYEGSHSCGLENLGNSCYMNSILQQFLQIPQVISFFSNETHFQECSIVNPTQCFQCQFTKFIIETQKNQSNHVVKPRMLKQVIGQNFRDFDNAKQQDCYEFFTVLLDLCEKCSYQTFHPLFTFHQHFHMVCMDCQNTCDSGSDEDNCITVQIPQDELKSSYSIHQLIQDSMNEEYMERDCEVCGKRTIWSRSPVIDNFPDYLCIRVNRFIIDNKTYTISKNTKSVMPDESLTISSSMNTDNSLNIPQQSYHCLGACLHRGNKADFGHYVSVYKTEEETNWILANDSKVVIVTDPPLGECYLLFYKKSL